MAHAPHLLHEVLLLGLLLARGSQGLGVAEHAVPATTFDLHCRWARCRREDAQLAVQAQAPCSPLAQAVVRPRMVALRDVCHGSFHCGTIEAAECCQNLGPSSLVQHSRCHGVCVAEQASPAALIQPRWLTLPCPVEAARRVCSGPATTENNHLCSCLVGVGRRNATPGATCSSEAIEPQQPQDRLLVVGLFLQNPNSRQCIRNAQSPCCANALRKIGLYMSRHSSPRKASICCSDT